MPFHLAGGVLAGAVAAIATSPIDAIKTRMQASTHPRLALLGARPVTLLPCCLQVYGRGAGIAATAAAMLRGHGTAAFTRLTPPPPPLPPLPRVWLRHACVGHHFAALVRRSVALMKFPE